MSTNDVKAARRTLDLLETFSAHRTPMSLTDLANEIGAPKTSCFELIQTLKARGYLYALGPRRGFYPTRRLLEHARIIADNDPILRRLEPALAGLRDATGETVILGKLQDATIVYLDVIEGHRSIRYSAQAGDHKPLHSSAIGKAFLGQMDDAELDAVLQSAPLQKITPNTVTALADLSDEIAAGRRLGYFVTRGENVADVTAVAATVYIHGEPFGVAVAGPSARMDQEIDVMAAQLLSVKASEEKAP
jgi:IclR family transcriptional regulator, acetate operon repressor